MPIDLVQKYDRQLRLWSSHGQKCLESSNICVIGSNNLATELLKNLILPGIGSFTIVDDTITNGFDIGSNFFLLQSHIGEKRGKSCCSLLLELNRDVRGSFIDKNLKEICKEKDFFKPFSLVICCSGSENETTSVAETCASLGILILGIPIVMTQIYGFIGFCRLVFNQHTVIESHPDSIIDLRLDKSWPELTSLSTEIDFDRLNSHQASHIPFPILILESVRRWKLSKRVYPPSRSERDEFNALLRGLVKVSQDDENVSEALSHCYRVFKGSSVPDDIQKYMLHPSSVVLTPDSSDFWVLMNALKRFVDAEGAGLLPVPGVLPDMKSDTDTYISLQNMQDLEMFKKYLKEAIKEIGHRTIPDDVIERFCKNAATLKVLYSGKFNQPDLSALQTAVDDPTNEAVFLLLLQAAERFRTLHARYPGTDPASYGSDTAAYSALFSAFLKELGVTANPENYTPRLLEFLRAGACELPSMAAIIGGIASQEIIKLLTKQYIPLDNAIIFNGVTSTSSVIKL